jgi:hypothetical protein
MQIVDIIPAGLECLYWYDGKKHGFVGISEIWSKVSLNELNYRLLIRVPEFITITDVEKAKNISKY